MVEAKKRPSEIVQIGNEVNAWIGEETVKLAETIQRQVNAFILPHKHALPQQLGVEVSGEETMPEGRLFGKYIEYDVETQQLSEVTEEYFEFGSKLPIMHKRHPLPITSWINYGPKVIETAIMFLRSQQDAQS